MTDSPDPSRGRPRMWPLIAAAIIMPSCAAIIVSSLVSLTYARDDLAEIAIAHSYACAYRGGQMGIMNKLPTIFPKEEAMSDDLAKSCEKFKIIAAKHGFDL